MALPPRNRRPRAARTDRATVAAGFVAGMLAGPRARGLDPAPLLREAGIAAAVPHDRRARVPLAAYVALYNAVVRTLGDEGFALFSVPLRPGTFEFLCRASAGSASLGEALARAARFLAVVLPDLAVTVSRARGVARLEIAERRRLTRRPDDPRRVFAFEWLLRLLHGLACWLAGRAIALHSVRFPFPRPAHAADYALVYTEHSIFDGATLAASFDAALLDVSVVRETADVDAFLEGAPGRISILYRRDREVVRRVRELLARDLGTAPSLEAAAHALRISPRTLHRRLAEEGSAFRAIREELRRTYALARLEKTRRRIADIAADIGYSEPSAFFRAFHSWTGESPSAYRKRVHRAR